MFFALACMALGTRAAASSPLPSASTAKAASETLPPLPPPPGSAAVSLYTKRLDFRHGEPTVSVRLMQGGDSVTFSPRADMRMTVHGAVDKTIEAPKGSQWTVRVLHGKPARLRTWIVLGQFRFGDVAGIEAAEKAWHAKGVKTDRHVIGALFGISGKVIDDRAVLLRVAKPFTSEAASARQQKLLHDFGAHTTRFPEVVTPPDGVLEVLDHNGASVALGEGRILATTAKGAGFDVFQVEHDEGYAAHGFANRSYAGALELTVGTHGHLAVVNLVGMEHLLDGLVPAEIYASAPMEALKAQAVTARGEVLAKIGRVHLADPYLLCSEQHCAVYKGLGGESPRTTAAVKATAGEVLVGDDGRLVDSVYSAVCGGHTENNENVWGGPPDPHLRGKPDLFEDGKPHPTPAHLGAFLSAKLPSACGSSRFTPKGRYRWTKRIGQDEMSRLTAALGIGQVQAISVLARGVSGRATRVELSGLSGATEVSGELTIRRLFGMLNSSMFLVTPERSADGGIAAWIFRGGGWGHGVGMCQTGAIGRAEHGWNYRRILRFYFTDVKVVRIY